MIDGNFHYTRHTAAPGVQWVYVRGSDATRGVPGPGRDRMRRSGLSRPGTLFRAGLLFGLLLAQAPCPAENAGKSVYLVDGDERVTAVNAETGQFFDLEFSAKEKVEREQVGNAVAVVITNQRFAAVGPWPGGWAKMRRRAGERLVSVEAEDYTAVVVTSDRILSFSGATGTWSEQRR